MATHDLGALLQDALTSLDALVAQLAAHPPSKRYAASREQLRRKYDAQHRQVKSQVDAFSDTRCTLAAAHLQALRESITEMSASYKTARAALEDAANRAKSFRRHFRKRKNVFADLQPAAQETFEKSLALGGILIHAVRAQPDAEQAGRPQQPQPANVRPQNTHGRNMLVRVVGSMPSALPPAQGDTPADKFKACVAVPPNPPRMLLRYAASHTNEARLKARLALAASRARVAAVGMGGVGKSCALRGLAHEPDVQARFAGGIHYLNLGEDARVGSIIEQLAGIVDVAGGPRLAEGIRQARLEVAVQKAKGHFQAGRQEGDSLFLIDDVWFTNDVDVSAFLVLMGIAECSEGSAVVLTTRDKNVAALADRVPFFTLEVSGDDAKKMLLVAAQFEEDEISDGECRDAVDHILQTCAGLPVALTIVGNAVLLLTGSLPDRWRAWSHYVNTETSESVIDSDIHGYPGLAKTFATALGIISANTIQSLQFPLPNALDVMFEGLCVLAKQGWAPVPMLQKLWRFDDQAKARKLCQLLANASLLEYEVRMVHGQHVEGIRMHDLVHEFCRQRAGSDEGVARWHKQLLQRLLPTATRRRIQGVTACRDWWSVPEEVESYVRENVARHLLAAGLDAELLQLLLSPRWVASKLPGAILQLEQECQMMITVLDRQGHGNLAGHNRTVRDEQVKALRFIANIARRCLSGLQRHPKQVWFQLYGRLFGQENECRAIKGFLEDIEKCAEKPWVRPLQPCLQGPGGVFKCSVIVESSNRPAPTDDTGAMSISLSNAKANIAVCGDRSGRAVTFDTNTGEILTRKSFDVAAGTHIVRVTADGKRFAAASRDGSIAVWHLEGGQKTCSCQESSPAVYLAISQDGSHLVSGLADHRVIVWNETNDTLAGTALSELNWETFSGAISAKGKHVAVGSDGGVVRLFDTRSTRQVRSFSLLGGAPDQDVRMTAVNDKVDYVFLTAGGERIAAASGERTCVWNALTGDQIWSSKGYVKLRPYSVVITPDASRLVAGCCAVIRMFDLDSGQEIPHESPPRWDDYVTSVQLTNDGRRVVAGGPILELRVFDIETGVIPAGGIYETVGTPTSLAAQADGLRVAMGFSDGSVRVYDPTSGLPVCAYMYQDSYIKCIAIAEDGSRAVSGSVDKMARVWDLATGKEICTLVGHSETVQCVFMTAEGAHVVTGSNDKTVRLWDAETGEEMRKASRMHEQSVTAVAVTPDVRWILSGCHDGTARAWKTDSAPHSSTAFTGHSGTIICVAVSDDGTRAVTGSDDRTFQVWYTATGSLMKGYLQSLDGMVDRVAFTADGETVVAVTLGSSVIYALSLEAGQRRGGFKRMEASFCSPFSLAKFVLKWIEDGDCGLGFTCGGEGLILEHGGSGREEPGMVLGTLDEPMRPVYVTPCSRYQIIGTCTPLISALSFLKLEM